MDHEELIREIGEQRFEEVFRLGYDRARQEVRALISELNQHCGTKEAHAMLDQLSIHVRAMGGKEG